MTLSDEALKEAIKEVKVETKPTANWDTCIKRRYMDYTITRAGKDVMIQFIQEIGPGSLIVDSWYPGMKNIRKHVSEAGYSLVKNKRSGGYAIYMKGSDPSDSFTFNPDLLDMEDDTQTEEAHVGK